MWYHVGGSVLPQPSVNRREYFRLGFADLTGSMQVIQVGPRFVTTESRPIRIENVGGGGLYIQSDEDLLIRREIIGIFQFSLGGQSFQFRGMLTRKVDDRKSYHYGVTFVDVDERARANLVAVLNRLQIERNAKAGA
jgi:c-di-GMP-binding flagellar brake protein YcgR